MDIATIVGLFLGWFGVIGGAILEGVHLGVLFKLSAFLIVGVGTAGATIMSFPGDAIRMTWPVLKKAFQRQELQAAEIVTQLVGFATKARREGLLGLEEEAENITDPFLKKGLQLVVDGTDIEMVRNIMETDIAYLEARHGVGQGIFGSAGGFSPTFGIIGTVLGLIHALAQMGEGGAGAAELAAAIATAFIATFYGIVFANAFLLPLAFKLSANSKQEVLLREVMLEGILSISAGDNPRIVEEKLKAFLPPNVKAELEAAKAEGGEQEA